MRRESTDRRFGTAILLGSIALTAIFGCGRAKEEAAETTPEPPEMPVRTAPDTPPQMTIEGPADVGPEPFQGGNRAEEVIDDTVYQSSLDGFFWHPTGGPDGARLEVVLPSHLLRTVERCYLALLGPEGWLPVENASRGGREGQRPHFTFDRPGYYYPGNIFLVVELKDGTTLHWFVENTSALQGDEADVAAARAEREARVQPKEQPDPSRMIDESAYDIRQPGGGFRWLPAAPNEQSLVVYLPVELKGNVTSCMLSRLSPNGWIKVEAGTTYDTNDIPRFTFKRPGPYYPSPIYIVARLADGTEIAWKVEKSSGSYE